MKSHNNKSIFNNSAHVRDRFSLRKLSIGLTSVLLGSILFIGSRSENVHASNLSLNDTNQSNVEKVISSQSNTPKQQEASEKKSNEDINIQTKNNLQKSDNDIDTKNENNAVLEEKSNQIKIEEKSLRNKNIDKNSNISKDSANIQGVKENKISNEKNGSSITPSFNFKDWITTKNDNGDLAITGYNGDKTNIYIPNNFDFTKANLLDKDKTVSISIDSMNKIFDKNKTISITISNDGDGKVIATGSDWHDAFSNSKLKKADLRGLDTSSINGMHAVFENDGDLENVDLSNWNVKNVKNTSWMFHNDSNLKTLDLNNWDVSGIQNLQSMFEACSSLTDLDLDKWHLSSATNVECMFGHDTNLATVELKNLGLENAQDLAFMFFNDAKLKTLDTSHWNLNNALNMQSMFDTCSDLENLDASNWGLKNVKNFSYVFKQNQNLKSIGDTTNWNLNNVEHIENLFENCPALQSLNTTNWGLKNAQFTSFMFFHDMSIKHLDTTNWSLKNVQNMQSMFDTCSNLVDLDASNWGLDSVTNICYAFVNDPKLISVGNTANWNLNNVISAQHLFESDPVIQEIRTDNWGLKNATDLSFMFFHNFQLKTLNTQNWNLNNAVNMQSMFDTCSNLENLDASNWGLKKVNNFSYVFVNDSKLKSIGDVSNWNLNNAVNLAHLFDGCLSLQSINTDNWGIANAQDISSMFQNDKSLKQINVSKWNTSNVRNMGSIFAGTTSLHYLDVSNWKLNNINTNSSSNLTNIFGLSGEKLVIGNSELNSKLNATNNSEQPLTYVTHLDNVYDLPLNKTYTSLEDIRNTISNLMKKYLPKGAIGWMPAKNAMEYSNTGIYDMYVVKFSKDQQPYDLSLSIPNAPLNVKPISPEEPSKSVTVTDTSSEHKGIYHMMTDQGWSNDLQTIIYNPVTKEYELYFLHSVDGANNVFGSSGQNWSRQVSKDLIHFSEPQNDAILAQPISMKDQNGKSVDLKENQESWKSAWTGSIIQNTYGLVKDVPKDAYIAYFSGLKKKDGSQNIYAVYSIDGGKTFDHVLNNGNPVVDHSWGSGDANQERDAGVFYYNAHRPDVGHDKTQMYMACAEGSQIGMYVSDDGIKWQKSDYNPKWPAKIGGTSVLNNFNDSDNPLECPAIRFMHVIGADGKPEKDSQGKEIVKAVIFFGGKRNQNGETTGTYYRVGHLDQNGLFSAEFDSHRVDEGSDYYGANFSGSADANKPDDSIISIGWVGNWSYTSTPVVVSGANKASQRIGSYSLPRKLVLRDNGVIESTPIDSEISRDFTIENKSNIQDKKPSVQLANQSAASKYVIDFSTKDGSTYKGQITISIIQGKDNINFAYNPNSGFYRVTGNSVELSGSAASYYRTGLAPDGGYIVQSGVKNRNDIKLVIYTDKDSVELFFPNGQTYTVARFNNSDKQDVVITSENIDENNVYEVLSTKIISDLNASKLKDSINESREKENTYQYFNASEKNKEALNKAITKGKELLAKFNNENTDQKQLDTAAKAIEDAQKALDGKATDSTELNKAIDTAQKAKSSYQYENGSAEKQKALDDAIKAAQGLKNPTQAEVDAATRAIEDAQKALDGKATDSTELNKAIDTAQKAKSNYQYENGSAEKQKALDDAIKAAQGLKNPTQAEVDAATQAIRNAISKLDGTRHDSIPSGNSTGFINNHQNNNEVDNHTNVDNNNHFGIKWIVVHSVYDRDRIHLYNHQGKMIQKTVRIGSVYKCDGLEWIKGKEFYRLIIGLKHYYLPKANVRSTRKLGVEKKIRLIIRVKGNKHSKKIHLIDWDGHKTNKIVKIGFTYKVWAKKKINGMWYFRIGNENEWILIKDTTIIKERW